MSVQEGLGLADDDVSGSVSLGVEPSKLEIKFLRLCLFSKFGEFFQNVLNLFLEDVVLQEDDSLRLEDFVLDDFASAGIREKNYKTLSYANLTLGLRALIMGSRKDMVLPDPLAARMR